MKKIHALVMSLIMLFTVLAPAQNVEAAGKSLKVSEKAFFKEMKEFDYKGMNRYVTVSYTHLTLPTILRV